MISVLIPCRDASATLAPAVASILGDMTENDEIVLVDDGSVDATPALVDELARSDRRVRSTRSHGQGLAAALNEGIALCRGAFIARMDADDISLPGRLAAQRALLASDPALGVAAARVEAFGSPGEGMLRYVAWQNTLTGPEDHARAIFVEAPVCHPSTMIRRSALDAVGGYRNGEFPEDYDLWLRLHDAGWGFAKVPEVLFRWRIHAASATFTDPRYARAAFRSLRAAHLARRLTRPFAIWGAGPAGRRLGRALEVHGARASFFIDIDPRKIGGVARGAPIRDVADGVAHAKAESVFLVVAVAARGARDLIRARLAREDLVEGPDFLCAT